MLDQLININNPYAPGRSQRRIKNQLRTILSICLYGDSKVSELGNCIKHAAEITQKLFFIDLGLASEDIARVKDLGIKVVNLDAFTYHIDTDWVLFIKPEEKVVLSSSNKLVKALASKQTPGYGVHTKTTKDRHLLGNYQWIMKLEQFKEIGSSDFIARIEPRLVKRSLAKRCIEGLVQNDTDEISWICGIIAPGLKLELSHPENEAANGAENVREHDVRCLKGELSYDVTYADDMVELSEAYTGFRIVHKGQLDGFIDGASRGFGHLRMYIPLLDFLCKEGFYSEAKQLFELWINNCPNEKKEFNTQLMGGMIYANLLDYDKAIEWFKMITEKSESALAYANLGKLYLIKGEKHKAIEHLEMSKDTEGDIFLKKRILTVIDNEEWRPLKLTLCMIARDEEEKIGKALQSVDGLVDEIVVVDTGSKDKTMEIIKEFGGKLSESEWEHDFSQARNLALHEATGDYILFMDADEFIHPTDRFGLALFKMLLPIEKDIAFGVKVEPAKETRKMSMAQSDILRDQKEDDYQIRIFPKKPGIQFQGKVFESLDETLNEKQVPVLRYDIVKITHSMEGREKRDGRKIPAITKSVGAIYDPRKALKAGILFLRMGDLESAYPWLIKAAGVDPSLSAKIGMLYAKQNMPEMAKEIVTNAMTHFPESSELVLSLAGAYHREENYLEVVRLVGALIQEIAKDLTSEEAALARYYLGIASIETGDVAYGIEQLMIAQEKNPANICYKFAGIYAFARVEQWEDALQAVGQIADKEEIDIHGEVDDFVDVGQIFKDLNRHFIREGRVEEANLSRKIIEVIIATKISSQDDIQRMANIVVEMGKATDGTEVINAE